MKLRTSIAIDDDSNVYTIRLLTNQNTLDKERLEQLTKICSFKNSSSEIYAVWDYGNRHLEDYYNAEEYEMRVNCNSIPNFITKHSMYAQSDDSHYKVNASIIKSGAILAQLDNQPLSTGVNECFLMHCPTTNSGALENILKTGLDENFAGTNSGSYFGMGLYFGDTIEKVDSYCTPIGTVPSGTVYERLYTQTKAPKPCSAKPHGLVLVCRVLLGACIRHDINGGPFIQNNNRELINVPTQNFPYHSLVGYKDNGSEFVLMHKSRIYPRYIVAFRSHS